MGVLQKRGVSQSTRKPPRSLTFYPPGRGGKRQRRSRELNEGIGAGKVSSLGILDRWAGELLGSVGLASMLLE